MSREHELECVIADLVQQAKEVRDEVKARIEELERELATERCLSFRSQVAELESERAALQADNARLREDLEFVIEARILDAKDARHKLSEVCRERASLQADNARLRNAVLEKEAQYFESDPEMQWTGLDVARNMRLGKEPE